MQDRLPFIRPRNPIRALNYVCNIQWREEILIHFILTCQLQNHAYEHDDGGDNDD